MSNTKLSIFAALAAVAYIASGVGGYYYGHGKGVTEGLDNFHEACYTGGFVASEKTGKVIQCGPVGMIPKEEFKNFFEKPLDKNSKTV